MKNIALHRPVVLSYFSQSGDTDNGFLPFLETEYKSMAEAWERSEIQIGSERYFEVFFPARGSADGDKVAEDVRDYKDRIILFHFSGHASSKKLLLMDGASHALGIAGLLGSAPNLKLVVLNGCATHDQVKLLFDNNVKVVIATKGKINDGIARKFAETFYKALSTTTFTIQSAYKHALSELQRNPSYLETVSIEPIIWRGLVTESEDDRDRWELYVREECKELIADPNWWRIGDLPSSYEKPATLLSTKGIDNPNVFIGRGGELENIRERLVKGGKLMLINAEGGIGKTTLAARYWYESLYEYQHNAWLFCENGIMNALKELAPKLNVDLAGMDENQQLATLRDALSQVHDDFLLVLDNANDADDIRAFKQDFAGFHWHVLITSRCQGVLDKEQELSITHLPPPLAKALFEKYYTEDSPDFDALLDRLLKAIGYHTLLVEVFAKNLHEASELGTSLDNFLQKLETGGLYLGEEDRFSIQTNYTGSVQKVAATTDDILDILYDFSTLTEDQRYLLVNLALLPAESYTMLFLAEVMTPTGRKAFHGTLKTLYQKGWMGGTDKTYRLSPVVQELVLKKNVDTLPGDTKALLQNLGEKLENDGANFTNLSFTQAAPFAQLTSSITQKSRESPTYELASLNFNAGIYFENTGDVVQAKQAFEKFGEISAACGYVENVAISYSKLGTLYEVTGEWNKALENYHKYNRLELELFQSKPENLSYKNNLSISYQNLGNVYETIGNWKKALENYQEQLSSFSEIYQKHPENLSYKNGLAISYQNLGNIHETIGNWNSALESYQEYNRLALEIHQSSPENLKYKNTLAISYEKVGFVYEVTENWKKALENYQQRQRISSEIYQNSPENLSNKYELAVSYEKLGGIHETTGNWSSALDNYQEDNWLALEIHQSSPENLKYKNVLAISYSKLGDIYEATGDWKNALENYQERNRIGLEIYQTSPENLSYKNGLAISYYKLGNLELRQDKLPAAVDYMLKSRVLFAELWQATQGQIVQYTYYFAVNTKYVTDIVKWMILKDYYKLEDTLLRAEHAKQMRREGYIALQPLAEADALHQNQLELLQELADESWYEF